MHAPYSVSETVLSFDDGSKKVGSTVNPDYIGAVKFSVSSITLTQVVGLMFYTYGDEMESVRVYVLDSSFNSIHSEEVIPHEGWVEVDISHVNVTVWGNFYIGLQRLSDRSPYLGKDTTSPHNKRSYFFRERGAALKLVDDGDYIIRASVILRWPAI